MTPLPESMSETGRRCPACSCEKARPLGCKNQIPLTQCARCKTLFAAEVPPPVTTQAFYDEYYTADNLAIPPFIRRRLEEIVADFAPYRQTNRLLDIGCGAGDLLQAAVKQGWEGYGTEVSHAAIEHHRNLGLNVFLGTLAEARYPDGHFDVITCSEVLEHVEEPGELVHEAARLLRRGGVFWLTTPHGRGLSYRLLGLKWSVVNPPEHLQLFSAKGMRLLLSGAGFQRSAISYRGCNVLEIAHSLGRSLKEKRTPVAATTGPGVPEETHRGESFNRVAAAYKLNEFLLRGRLTRGIKRLLNGTLTLTRLGDSLHVLATLG